jgi:predicted GNAT family acetyltransferase
MEILHDQTVSKGMFFIGEKNKPLAEMTYSKAGSETIIIDHTQVTDALKGQSAGKKLVTAAVEYARENKIKIIPLCPFAKSVFEKVKEFQDVLK